MLIGTDNLCDDTRPVSSHPLTANAVVGHVNKKKDMKNVCLAISDADFVREINRLIFDYGKT